MDYHYFFITIMIAISQKTDVGRKPNITGPRNSPLVNNNKYSTYFVLPGHLSTSSCFSQLLKTATDSGQGHLVTRRKSQPPSPLLRPRNLVYIQFYNSSFLVEKIKDFEFTLPWIIKVQKQVVQENNRMWRTAYPEPFWVKINTIIHYHYPGDNRLLLTVTVTIVFEMDEHRCFGIEMFRVRKLSI